MDELKIKSSFMRNLLTKIISRTIKKKYGYDVDILLNDLVVTFDSNGQAHLHTNIDLYMDKNELTKIVKSIGIDEA